MVAPRFIMVTLPIDLGLSVAAGSTVALASRSTASEYRVLRSPAFWSLLAFELLIFVPVGAYLLWRFPAWSLMYLIDPDSLPMPPAYLAVLYPVIAVSTFIVCRRLLLVRKLIAVLGVLGGCVLAVALIGFFGFDQISVIGSTAEFRTDPGQMRDVTGSALGYVGAAGLAAVVISWAVTLWRLMLLGRVARHGTTATATTEEEEPSAKRRTKKKAS
jgi:hypothetical protein